MSEPRARELLVLDPGPAAAAAARRFVSGCLAGAPEDAVANAELIISELVTNSILHAGTAVRIGLKELGPVVRLEVGDQDRNRPEAKRYSPEAGTGRGLQLVEALALAWGVDSGPDGKTVWADVPLDPVEMAVPPLRTAGGVMERPEPPPARTGRPPAPRAPSDPLVEVHLVSFPVDVYRRTEEHMDELQREFALILEREPGQGTGPPGRLLALVREFGERFGGFALEARDAVRTASEEGRARIDDVVYRVPADVGPAASRLEQLLAEADAYCRAGDLLTLACPPEACTFREWFLGQFAAQAGGAPSVSWPEWAAGAQPA
ncbi:MAG TPA: ATP-binding protein [Acidimicrobiales bacterium]|nr:ATP-binding protein [Acidimicrobiales bacterium]